MDQSQDQSSTSLQPKLTTFPSIQRLFQESWQIFVKNILPLLLLNLPIFIMMVVILVLTAVISFVAAASKMSPETKSLISNLSAHPANLLNPQVSMTFIYAILGFFIFFLLIGLVSMVMSIASVIVVSDTEKKIGVGQAIKMSFRSIIPLIIIGWITGFITMGGLFLFIIPGLIIGFFFTFVQLEVILGGKKLMKAIESSVYTVKLHFGEIAIRTLILLILILGIRYGIPGLFAKTDSGARSIVTFLFVILQPLLTWFSLCYSVVLYKHAKSVTPDSTEKNIGWLIAIGILGWIVAGLLLFGILFIVRKTYGLSSIQDLLKKSGTAAQKQSSSEASILAYAPTSCGLSVPIPKTTTSENGVTRKWYYEQVPMNRSAFPVLDSDLFPVATVLGEFVGYKDSPFPDDKSSFKVGYPGLNIYCVDNDKGYTLDEFISLALTSKKNKVTKQGAYKWGEVDMQLVWVEGKDNGKDMKDIAYLGVSKDGKRLIYMRIWGTDDKDKSLKQIETDTNTILKYLKYRTVTDNIKDMKFATSSTTQQKNTTTQTQKPACLTYQIREGEFASNKCYNQSDYNDLDYYTGRFNSAAAQYNGAIASINITCNGSDFFKNSCENDKKQKDQAEKDLNTYRAMINTIIGRGK